MAAWLVTCARASLSFTRTHSATRQVCNCSGSVAGIAARCRNISGTPTSRRRPFTRGSRSLICRKWCARSTRTRGTRTLIRVPPPSALKLRGENFSNSKLVAPRGCDHRSVPGPPAGRRHAHAEGSVSALRRAAIGTIRKSTKLRRTGVASREPTRPGTSPGA